MSSSSPRMFTNMHVSAPPTAPQAEHTRSMRQEGLGEAPVQNLGSHELISSAGGDHPSAITALDSMFTTSDAIETPIHSYGDGQAPQLYEDTRRTPSMMPASGRPLGPFGPRQSGERTRFTVQPPAQQRNTVPRIVHQRRVYEQSCRRCHGNDCHSCVCTGK